MSQCCLIILQKIPSSRKWHPFGSDYSRKQTHTRAPENGLSRRWIVRLASQWGNMTAQFRNLQTLVKFKASARSPRSDVSTEKQHSAVGLRLMTGRRAESHGDWGEWRRRRRGGTERSTSNKQTFIFVLRVIWAGDTEGIFVNVHKRSHSKGKTWTIETADSKTLKLTFVQEKYEFKMCWNISDISDLQKHSVKSAKQESRL